MDSALAEASLAQERQQLLQLEVGVSPQAKVFWPRLGTRASA